MYLEISCNSFKNEITYELFTYKSCVYQFNCLQKNELRLRGPWRSGSRRWVPTIPGEHFQKIAASNPTQAGQRFTWSKSWCNRQQLWKAVTTGDTVTRLSIPIRGRGKSPEEGQRWNLAETLWKKKQHKNYQDEDKKSAINK